MPKNIVKLETQKKYKEEEISQIETSEKTTINDFSDEKEHNVTFNNINYLYFTPIPNVKRSCYIPSTPKKTIDDRYEDTTVKGKNLINLFESM